MREQAVVCDVDPEVLTMRLDQRSPLVVNTHDLGRRPGTMRAVDLTVPAPADLGIEVLGVPEGAPVHLDCVWSRSWRACSSPGGAADAGRASACGAGRSTTSSTVDFQELYVYDDSREHLRGDE